MIKKQNSGYFLENGDFRIGSVDRASNEVGQASNRMIITFHGAWIGVRTCVLFLLALCAWWRSVGSSILPFLVSFRQ